ncbi:hypothetical protein E0L93_14585 [Rubrobacter taiwanensis]|jgi:hypothetical protein|uniref:DUF5668 domain-containing protein n=1 Tax=Rubrobacter taiwanensis TaxID=185139 RepID=A0A4V2NVI8_9ACTN|nr:hypothetical protein [Rubrobacter taiwanensis]TCJ13642.1 hypothetical protein E0L93_14585 [Rubrobacter taiwanensis]
MRALVASGIVLVAAGIYLLLPGFGVLGLPPIGAYWPAPILLAGIISLWAYFSRRGGPEEIFFGLALTGLGAVLLLHTLRGYGAGVGDLLPAVFFVAGLAFLARYGVDRSTGASALALGLVLTPLGTFYLLVEQGLLNPAVASFWPVLLILGGLPLLFARK